MSQKRGKRRHEPETPKPCPSSRCPRASLHNSPECTVNISDRCAGSNWTSRWYHVTTSEHYCNECFEHAYRNPIAMGAYIAWQKQWHADSQIDPTIKIFFAEQILPFWLCCKDCGKWRRVTSTDLPIYGLASKANVDWNEVISNDRTVKEFVCGDHTRPDDKEKETCSTPEDPRASDALGVFWLADLGYLPFLLSSLAEDMCSAYYLDGVGISPVGVWNWAGKELAIATVKIAEEAAAATAAAATAAASTVVSPAPLTTAASAASGSRAPPNSSLSPVATPNKEVKMEVGGPASASSSTTTTGAPIVAVPALAASHVSAVAKPSKPFSSTRSSYAPRPLRRHQIGKHGGPGRAKKRKAGDESSDDEEISRKFGYFQPFHRPTREIKARSFRPDTMEPLECRYFPEFGTLKTPTLYLGLRNLILALWNKQCTEPLTIAKIMRHVLLRGMVRIRCQLEVGRILAFLTRHAYVNAGFVQPIIAELPAIGIANRPKQPLYPRWTSPSGAAPSVIVIGAGPAGLSAAYHLKRLGIKAEVVEARDRIGGRVCDDRSLGTCVGRGAQIVNGCINNPISTMCEQAGIPMRRLAGQCVLIDENGKCPNAAEDERVENFFNTLLDLVGDWRQEQLAAEERALKATQAPRPSNRPAKRARSKSSNSRRSSTDGRTSRTPAATAARCPDLSADGVPGNPGTAVNLQVSMSTPPSSCATTAGSVQTTAGGMQTAEARPSNAMATGVSTPITSSPLSVSAVSTVSSVSTGTTSQSPVVGTSSDPHSLAIIPTSASSSLSVISPEASPTSMPTDGSSLTSSQQQEQQQEQQVGSASVELKSDGPHNEAHLAEMMDKAKDTCAPLLSDNGHQEDEQRLLDFHLGNLEYSCGAMLHQVSAMFWDQNEHFPQFLGDHTIMTDGFSPILKKLAATLDIRLKCPVSRVDYEENVVQVLTDSGEVMPCDFVIVTAPLSVLKRELISFNPPLPDWKQDAIRQLGAGLIEKVALRFPRRFWAQRVMNSDFFGHVASDSQARGLCGVFYDLSFQMPTRDNAGVLMTIVSGKALDIKSRLTETELVDKVVELLRCMFPEEIVPEPEACFVSDWANDPWAGMSYSYVAAGGSGADYERLAEPIANRVLFAGEATNRQHPQTVTGAFLSGVREAARVADMTL